ncbi:unnamed protein product, partial [Prorocentrum cordatum]
IAATRRSRNAINEPAPLRAVTEVEVRGHLKTYEKEAIEKLMTHLRLQGGRQLRKGGDADTGLGTWTWLAGQDPGAPPGRSRLFLAGEDEVARARASLHNETVKIGSDAFTAQVFNDFLDSRAAQ